MIENDRTAEARRKAQRNGEEDPVVIAQRFLNIYRQIHIFTPERKAAFNKMLLELPAEIRGLFGSLPGGALLQDYVDELAEKEGIEKSKSPLATAAIDDDEVSKAKILATALAEAQVQASAKMQTAPFPQGTTAAAPAGVTAVSSKISLDKDFASTFAATLADAMQKNNASQKDDIRNIIQTLGQTQLQIVKVLQNESAQQRQEMQSIYKAISDSEAKIASAGSQEKTAKPALDESTKTLIKVLVDGQQKLVERFAKIETATNEKNTPADTEGFKQLSRAIMVSQENFGKTIAVLSERQKKDTLEIAKLINESQQQMMNFMVQHNTLNQNSGHAAASNNNANNIQINNVDYSRQLEKIVEKLENLQINVSLPQNAAAPSAANFNFDSEKIGKMLREVVSDQSRLYREMAKAQTEELGSIISAALKESQKLSAQSLLKALRAQPVAVQIPAANISPAAKDNTFAELSEQTMPSEAVFEDAATAEMPVSDEVVFAPVATENSNAVEPAAPMEKSAVVPPVFEEVPAPTNGETAPKKKKKKKKKKKNAAAHAESSDILPTEISSEDSLAEQPAGVNTAPAASDISEPTKDRNLYLSALTGAAPPMPDPEDIDDLLLDDKKDFESETAVENLGANWLGAVEEEAAEPDPQPTFIPAENDLSADDWGFGSHSELQPLDAARPTDSNPGDENTEALKTNDGEGEDWVWEYVEENSETNDVNYGNDNLEPILQQSAICSGESYYQNPSSAGVSIPSSTPFRAGDYRLSITDSAADDVAEDPFKRVL